MDFHSKHVESIKLPNTIGAGIYPNRRNITNCMPKANDRSSADTDLKTLYKYLVHKSTKYDSAQTYLKTIINNGICVDATINVIKNNKIKNG